jgi:hypothetical protein
MSLWGAACVGGGEALFLCEHLICGTKRADACEDLMGFMPKTTKDDGGLLCGVSF